MKTGKTIVSVLVMAVVLSCSLFPVFAHTNTTRSNQIDSNLTEYLDISCFDGFEITYSEWSNTGSVSQPYYDPETYNYYKYDVLVNYRIRNTSDQDASLGRTLIEINLDPDNVLYRYDLVGCDYVAGALEPYVLEYDNNIKLRIIDGTEANIIVPAGGYISGTFKLTYCRAYETYETDTCPQFGAIIPTWGSFSVTYGTFDTTILDYVSDIYAELLDQGVSLDDLNNETTDQGLTLDEIYNLLNSNQTFETISLPSFFLNTNHASSTVDGVVLTRQFSSYGYQLVGVTTVWDPNSSSYIERYLIKLPIHNVVSLRNGNNFRVSGNSNVFTVTLHSSSAYNNSYYVGSSLSNYDLGDFSLYNFSGSVYTRNFTFGSSNGVDIILPANSTTRFSFDYDIYYSFTSLDTFTYVPSFYGSPSNPGWTEYITDPESDLNTIHDQEQQWYQQNEDAIESTGLANYSFTTNQISGIGTISSQFALVWNALGDWTLIYIFVLTLSLATFILRHRPSTKASQRAADSEKMRMINHQTKYAGNAHYRYYYDEANK